MPVDHLNCRPAVKFVSAIHPGTNNNIYKEPRTDSSGTGSTPFDRLLLYVVHAWKPKTTGRRRFQPTHKEKSRALLHLDAAALLKWP